MEVTLPISSLLIIAIDSVGISISIFVGLKLINQKIKKHISVNLLSVLLILAGLSLLNDLLVTSGISNRFPGLYFLPIFYSLSIGPLFYLFIKSKYTLVLKKTDYLHLIIPSLQALIYFFIGFRSVKFKIELWETTSFPIYLQIESFLFPISLIVYTIGCLFILKKNNSVNHYWTDDLRKWLKRFSFGMLFIAAIELGFSLFELFSIRFEIYGFSLVIFHALTLSAFTFWIAINGLKQHAPLQIYSSSPNRVMPIIDDEKISSLKKQLKDLMELDQIFINPDLNSELLASYLNLSEKACSYLLNQKMDTNFNNIVNKYRIEEFKKKIQNRDFERFTLTSIAYECGFNSKSTFNRAFKLECGKTPSEYVNQLKAKF